MDHRQLNLLANDVKESWQHDEEWEIGNKHLVKYGIWGQESCG
jgi:hypothetical protein